MTILHKRAVIFSIAALALSSASWSAAAQNYPDKPIKIIVTVAAGGPMDTMARFVGQQMQMRLGQPVVVENRPGAGTTIGAKAVVQRRARRHDACCGARCRWSRSRRCSTRTSTTIRRRWCRSRSSPSSRAWW